MVNLVPRAFHAFLFFGGGGESPGDEVVKWPVICLGFNGAETNCRIAHILGSLLMISY